MIAIYNNGEKITYTKGDTFELEINSLSFSEGDKCVFVVSVDEESDPIINTAFLLKEGSFVIELNLSERNRLELGDYIYKITILSVDGKIETTVSGDFKVKWGV